MAGPLDTPLSTMSTYPVDMEKYEYSQDYSEKNMPQLLPMMAQKLQTRTRRIPAGLALVVVVLFYGLRIATEHRSIYLDNLRDADHPPMPNSKIHLIITVPEMDDTICRPLLSAAVLNFSTPTILNSGKLFPNIDLPGDCSHISEISSIYKYLDSINRSHDDDLVLMVEGSDTWFQLRPEHLIQRYHDLNHAARKRLLTQLGRAMLIENISQSIVFSSRQPCNADCEVRVQSDLHHDLLVPGANMLRNLFINAYKERQVHTLGTKVIMGPVGGLRNLFSVAHERSVEVGFRGTTTSLLAKMFGEQEHQRMILQQKYLPSNWWRMVSFLERIKTSILRRSDPRSSIELSDAAIRDRISHEFGIGLDYDNILGSPTSENSHWLIHSSSASLTAVSRFRSFLATHVTRPAIPISLLYSRPPFPFHDKSEFPSFTSWNDVPLYTNLESGEVPVMIQSALENDWKKMWWQPYARELLTVSGKKGSKALKAHVAAAAGGTWWASIRGYESVNVDGIATVGWEALCGGTDVDEEVFGDLTIEDENFDDENFEDQNFDDEDLDDEDFDDEDFDDEDFEDENFDDEDFDNENFDDEDFDNEDFDNEDFEDENLKDKSEDPNVQVRVERQGYWIEHVEQGEVTWRVVKQP